MGYRGIRRFTVRKRDGVLAPKSAGVLDLEKSAARDIVDRRTRAADSLRTALERPNRHLDSDV